MPSSNHLHDICALFVRIIWIIADVSILFIKVLYAIILSIRHLIVPMERKPVRGEVVLVTGGGHGMGRELAFLYAAEGATVVIWDINEKNGNEAVEEIDKKGYSKAHFFLCDVSNHENVLNVAKEVQEKVGDVTILINNAGIMPTHPFLLQTKDEIERVININVMAHFWTLQAFLPNMKNQNYGHVVSLSSIAGLYGLPNLVPYCCSKFAVRGLMAALYEEFRQDKNNQVKFTSVYPYMVDTGLCKKPKIKFQEAMPLVDPKVAAKEIMNAQRLELREIAVPRFILSGINVLSLLPEKAQNEVTDFIGAGVESDL